jgi:hypothetical protein
MGFKFVFASIDSLGKNHLVFSNYKKAYEAKMIDSLGGWRLRNMFGFGRRLCIVSVSLSHPCCRRNLKEPCDLYSKFV